MRQEREWEAALSRCESPSRNIPPSRHPALHHLAYFAAVSGFLAGYLWYQLIIYNCVRMKLDGLDDVP